MLEYIDFSSDYMTPKSRIRMQTISICLLCMISLTCHADREDWLELESGGFKIFKRFGLAEGERLTLTLYPPVRHEPHSSVQQFYKLVHKDISRAGIIVDQYQTEIAEMHNLSVIITLRRFRNPSGAHSLVYYQGFHRPGLNLMWFVRTDLDDNLSLLINHYDEVLDIILQSIGISQTS